MSGPEDPLPTMGEGLPTLPGSLPTMPDCLPADLLEKNTISVRGAILLMSGILFPRAGGLTAEE